jgi:hypothetical protein
LIDTDNSYSHACFSTILGQSNPIKGSTYIQTSLHKSPTDTDILRNALADQIPLASRLRPTISSSLYFPISIHEENQCYNLRFYLHKQIDKMLTSMTRWALGATSLHDVDESRTQPSNMPCPWPTCRRAPVENITGGGGSGTQNWRQRRRPSITTAPSSD